MGSIRLSKESPILVIFLEKHVSFEQNDKSQRNYIAGTFIIVT